MYLVENYYVGQVMLTDYKKRYACYMHTSSTYVKAFPSSALLRNASLASRAPFITFIIERVISLHFPSHSIIFRRKYSKLLISFCLSLGAFLFSTFKWIIQLHPEKLKAPNGPLKSISSTSKVPF